MFQLSDDELEFIIAEPAVSDKEIFIPDMIVIDKDTGLPKCKKVVATYMNRAVKAAERIKKKYKKERKLRKIGELNNQNKAATDWLRQAGYLDTKDLDAIQYNYICNINKSKDDNKADTI